MDLYRVFFFFIKYKSHFRIWCQLNCLQEISDLGLVPDGTISPSSAGEEFFFVVIIPEV